MERLYVPLFASQEFFYFWKGIQLDLINLVINLLVIKADQVFIV
jgi:hypothetical protein